MGVDCEKERNEGDGAAAVMVAACFEACEQGKRREERSWSPERGRLSEKVGLKPKAKKNGRARLCAVGGVCVKRERTKMGLWWLRCRPSKGAGLLGLRADCGGLTGEGKRRRKTMVAVGSMQMGVGCQRF